MSQTHQQAETAKRNLNWASAGLVFFLVAWLFTMTVAGFKADADRRADAAEAEIMRQNDVEAAQWQLESALQRSVEEQRKNTFARMHEHDAILQRLENVSRRLEAIEKRLTERDLIGIAE